MEIVEYYLTSGYTRLALITARTGRYIITTVSSLDDNLKWPSLCDLKEIVNWLPEINFSVWSEYLSFHFKEQILISFTECKFPAT